MLPAKATTGGEFVKASWSGPKLWTSRVPDAVPSVAHSSRAPPNCCRLIVKKTVPPTAVKLSSVGATCPAGGNDLTSTVPTAGPELAKRPMAPEFSTAENRTVPSRSVMLAGAELAVLTLMSRTIVTAGTARSSRVSTVGVPRRGCMVSS